MISILVELFVAFLQIGLFTFGGGYAMIPLIQEKVSLHGWLSESSMTLVDFIAVSETTPGPFAINIATFIGMEEAGILGAIVATLGVVMPSFLIILLIAKFFQRFSSNPTVKAVMSGIRPVVVGVLLSVMIAFLVNAIFQGEVLELNVSGFDPIALIIFVVVFLLSRFVKKISPILLIVLSAGLGMLFYGLFGGF